jgi:hypothetical protein
LFNDISANVGQVPRYDYYIVEFSGQVSILGDLISPDASAGADPDLSILSDDLMTTYETFESIGNELNLSATLDAGTYVFLISTYGSVAPTSYTLSLSLN